MHQTTIVLVILSQLADRFVLLLHARHMKNTFSNGFSKLWWPVCAISSFRSEKTPLEKTKRRTNAMRKKTKKQKTPCETTNSNMALTFSPLSV